MIKLHNAKNFSKEIESLVSQYNMSYMDAIVTYVKKVGLDMESVPRLINPKIKDKLHQEATKLNMLGKTDNSRAIVED